MPQIYGHARVSTDGQTLDVHVAQLRATGTERVLQEKVSKAKSEQAQLQKLLDRLSPGDLLLVSRLDRLARSTRKLLNLLGTVAEKGAAFRSLAAPLGRHHDLAWTAHAYGAGGTSGARAHPHRRGPYPCQGSRQQAGPRLQAHPHQQQEAKQRLEAGEAITPIARIYAVHHSTISRL